MVILFAKKLGFSLGEMDEFTLGQILDMVIENYNQFLASEDGNDGKGHSRQASQADWDKI